MNSSFTSIRTDSSPAPAALLLVTVPRAFSAAEAPPLAFLNSTLRLRASSFFSRAVGPRRGLTTGPVFPFAFVGGS